MFDDNMYSPDERDKRIFGEVYDPPPKFHHGEYHPIVYIEKTASDGQPVVIDECRLPARFYRLRALPSKNSIDKDILPLTIESGSGDEMGHLILKIAKEFAAGMLRVAN